MSHPPGADGAPHGNAVLFASIAADIAAKGYSVHSDALSTLLLDHLWERVLSIPAAEFNRAAVGREGGRRVNNSVRTDEICWIDGENATGKAWLGWAGSLRLFLNRSLFLGLHSFESHFAHYAPGDFYKKHHDAFKGEANRILSLVLYLNPQWQAADGGGLLLQVGEGGRETVTIAPACGTLVVFLSEDFAHEVLAAHRDRYSIAGWFRARSR